MAISLSGSLITLGFARRNTLSGSLVTLGVDNRAYVSGSLLTLGFARHKTLSGSLITIGMQHRQPETKPQADIHSWQFLSAQHDSPFVGDFDLRVRVDNQEVDLCRFAETLQIGHGENESFVCYLTLQQIHHRPTQPINLYAWYGKEIIIDLVSNTDEMRLYRGIVDSAQLDFVSGKTKITCTDRRKRLMDKLPQSVVRAIGYTSEAIHGKFDNLADELDKRLQTIPASFEFDAYGNGYLNYWKPQHPTHTIGDCDVFYTQPQVTLAQVGRVINRVNIKLDYQYSRLIQRRIHFLYHSGLTPCSNGYTKYPTLDGLIEAVAQTGWVMGGGSLERDPPNGWYQCNGKARGYMRTIGGRVIMNGQFEGVKQWTQNVSEQYTISLVNQDSIRRYEELSENVSGSVSVESHQDDWHAPQTPEYEAATGNRYTALYLGAPHFKGVQFYQAENGDWIGNLDNAYDEFQAAFNVLYWTAYTKMLASHRQNTFEADIKFMPDLSLRHSHYIQHTHFSGLVKVAGFTHTIDLINRHVKTHIRYQFFQNEQGTLTLTEPTIPERIPPTFSPYPKSYAIYRKDMAQDDDIERVHGLIYQKSHITFKTQNYKLIGWRIPTPDIAKAFTDAHELTAQQDYAVGLYNDDVEILI